MCVCFMASAVDIPLFFGLIYTPYTLESDSRYPRVPLFSPLSYHVCHVLDCDSSSSVTPPPLDRPTYKVLPGAVPLTAYQHIKRMDEGRLTQSLPIAPCV